MFYFSDGSIFFLYEVKKCYLKSVYNYLLNLSYELVDSWIICKIESYLELTIGIFYELFWNTLLQTYKSIYIYSQYIQNI